jgi:hypothetical protein
MEENTQQEPFIKNKVPQKGQKTSIIYRWFTTLGWLVGLTIGLVALFIITTQRSNFNIFVASQLSSINVIKNGFVLKVPLGVPDVGPNNFTTIPYALNVSPSPPDKEYFTIDSFGIGTCVIPGLYKFEVNTVGQLYDYFGNTVLQSDFVVELISSSSIPTYVRSVISFEPEFTGSGNILIRYIRMEVGDTIRVNFAHTILPPVSFELLTSQCSLRATLIT